MSSKHGTDYKQDEGKEGERFESGYVKMTQSNADPRVYWAVYMTLSNQLHLFDKEASLNESEEIIYLSTCNVIKSETKNKQYIILEDYCVGIRYKFEPAHVYDHDSLSLFGKINLFIQECIVDFICTDINQMNARQQFNRFLLNQTKNAKIQLKHAPKLVDAVQKAEECDKALNDATNWLQRQQLDDNERKTFGEALAIRNKFWNLLIQTRDFINKGYVNSLKICSVFTRWDKMSTKNEKLTQHDKKILVWGLNELQKFTAEDKIKQANDLKKKWEKLGENIVDCQVKLQELQTKWKDIVERAEKVSSWCNWIGWSLYVVGYAGMIFTIGAGAAGWVPLAFGGVALAGLGVVIYGDEQLKAVKKTKKTIDGMQKHLKSYGNHVQDWVEAIALLEYPLWDIALGSNDFKPTINSWEQIAEHEKDLLKQAANTFSIFRDQSLKSLNAIRHVQQNLQ